MLTFEEARQEIERHGAQLQKHAHDCERISLLEADGRVLAQAVICDRDLPSFDRATRDGYAIRSADLTSSPAALLCVGSIRAGEWHSGELHAGECIEIMTGAPVPAGADAVVMVEHTHREDARVIFARGASSGENIVATGSEAKRGDTLVSPGVRLDYSHIAACAAVGAATISVYRKPRVAILSTGDEIVPIEAHPGRAQIRNSNAFSLAAQVERAGASPVLLPITPDEAAPLRELLRQGQQHDLLLITGGVSMGKHDLVESALTELGAEFYFTGAKIQPGKPIVFGSVSGGSTGGRSADTESASGLYFFGLPGNPVSTMVTFELFARPLIEALAGEAPQPLRTSAARLTTPVRAKPGLTRFLPAQLTPANSTHSASAVTPTAWQGSGDIVSIARSNCWLIVPPDHPELAAGELVSILLR